MSQVCVSDLFLWTGKARRDAYTFFSSELIPAWLHITTNLLLGFGKIKEELLWVILENKENGMKAKEEN